MAKRLFNLKESIFRMLYNEVISEADDRTRAIEKYSRHKPGLKWGPHDHKGVYGSGWNPLRGVNICFKDESLTENRMWFVIELPFPGITMTGVSVLMLPCIPFMYKQMVTSAVAIGYFFNRDPITGKVNLQYRMKPFQGN